MRKVKALFTMGILAASLVISYGNITHAQSNESEEPVVKETTEDGNPFSIAGNARVLDDVSDDETKEFITVATKNNQTFFVVIDRSSAADNVYMLSMIDEDDLKDFVKSDSAGLSLKEDLNLDTQKDNGEEVLLEKLPEQEPEKPDIPMQEKNSVTLFMMMGCFFLVIILAGYYFKIYRPRKEAEDDREEGIEADEFEEEDEPEEIVETEEAAEPGMDSFGDTGVEEDD